MALDKDSKLIFPHVLLIDASAGSGKTETLAHQYIQFILSDKIKNNDLANILAITFTNNAAREMKQRIMKQLKILALDKEDSEEKERIYALFDLKPENVRARALRAIESIISRYSDLHIQTIDSFMNRILRSSAEEMGMPPDNDVTEDYADLTRQAMDSLFAGFGTAIPFAEIESFLDLFNQSQPGKFYFDPSDMIQQQFIAFLIQEGKVRQEIEFTDAAAAARQKFLDLYELYQKIFKLAPGTALMAHTREGLADGNFDFFKTKFFDGFSREFCGLQQRSFKALMEKEGGPELVERLRAGGQEFIDLVSLAKYEAYGPLYRRFKIALEAVKRWSETIHFDDINKKLSVYIKREIVPEIYYRLGDVLYHFLLDEFQDTSQVQWENIKPLLHEAYAKGGSLFAVGDMKQAIYMWRKADYRIMWELVRCIRGELGADCLPASVRNNARIIPLKYNYRSGGQIMDYVDSVFKKRLKEFIPDLLPVDRTGLTEYEQKVPENKRNEGYVRSIIIPASEETPEKEVLIRVLKDVVARYPLRHIAILTSRNEDVERIVAWLTEAGIRAASLSSLDIRKRKIIMELVSLLQFLDAPIDDLSFASFITGEVFLRQAREIDPGVDREAVFDMLLEKTLKDKDAQLYTYFREREPFRAMWEKYFNDLFRFVGYYPLYDLVAEVYKKFDLFINFPDETGFLVRFLESITALESQGLGDIKDFAGLVNEEGQGSVLSILLPDYVDAVKAMTFYKAKGLGFPVVINLIYESDRKPGNMFYDHQENRLLIRYLSKGMAGCDTHLSELYSEAILDGRIQDLNVLYVATTRAKNELYNLVVRKIKQEDPAKTAEPKSKKPIAVDLFEATEIGKKEKKAADKTVRAPLSVAIPRSTIYEPVKEEDKNWSVARSLESQKGDLFHEILAGIEYVTDDIELVVTGLTAKALAEARLALDPDDIKTALLIFLNDPAVKPWFERKKSREVLREAEFVNDEGSLYRMDRVLIDTDQITLIDYKIGHKLAFYSRQMKQYQKILKAIYPDRKIASFWAYIDTARVEEVA